MTTTYTIPAQGLRVELTDGRILTAQERPTGGYLVQIRHTNGEVSGKFHSFESTALTQVNAIVELYGPVAA